MIGERIRKYRKRHRWSQHELARRSHVPQALISRLESGRRDTVTTDVAKRLARALGVGIDYLVGTWDNGEEEGTPDESEPEASRLAPTGTRASMAW